MLHIFADSIEKGVWPEIEDVTNGLLENGMYLGQPVDKVVAEIDRKTRPLFERGESAESAER